MNGTVETKQAFNFTPGRYRLQFAVLGNDGDARVDVNVGGLANASFTDFIGGTIEVMSFEFDVIYLFHQQTFLIDNLYSL